MRLYRWLVKSVADKLTPERLRLYPPHIPVLLILAWVISQVAGQGLTDLRGTIVGSDFLAFYTAGKFYLGGRMDELYNLYSQSLFQKGIIAPVESTTIYPFINPPFTAPFFAVFSTGGYLQSLLLWWLVGWSMLILSIHMLRREIEILQRYSTTKLLWISCMFFPTVAWFIYGQNTPYTLFAFTLFFVMLRNHRDFLAGLALGFLLYKPQLVILPFLIIAIKGRWKTVLGGAAGAGAWLLLGFLSGPKEMLYYIWIAPHIHELLRLNPDTEILQALFHLNSGIDYPTWGIHSFWGFAVLLLDHVSRNVANLVGLLLTVIGLGCAVAVWMKVDWKPGTRQWDLTMAASLAMGFLISPHLFTYDLTLMLLPIAIVWSYHPPVSGRPLGGGNLLFWSFLLYVFSFVGAYVSAAQLKLTVLLGVPSLALQVTTIIIAAWIWQVISGPGMVCGAGDRTEQSRDI